MEKLRLRFYERYFCAPARHRERIWARLDRRNSLMCSHASGFNAPIVIAFVGGEALGWATCLPRGSWDEKRRSVMVFVHHSIRRQGIGTKLIERLFERCDLYDKTVTIDKGAAPSFFKACGFKDQQLTRVRRKK